MKREILGSEGCHNMWPSWTCDWIVNNRTIKHNPFKSQNHEVGLNSKILPVATNTSDCSRPENCCIIVWSVHWMTSLSQAQTQENADCGRDGCARCFFFFSCALYINAMVNCFKSSHLDGISREHKGPLCARTKNTKPNVPVTPSSFGC